jgi:hypothetical protein
VHSLHMSGTSVLGACFDGYFDVEGRLEPTTSTLVNMHTSGSDIVSSFKPTQPSGSLTALPMAKADDVCTSKGSSPLDYIHSFKSPSTYMLRKSRINDGVACVAGLGIFFEGQCLLRKPIETFTSLGAADRGTKVAGPIGNKITVYNITQ